MIIKLSGADFSENNIGTIDLRTDINSTTQALLDIYNKDTWLLNQKLSIEDFLLSLDVASYKSKITHLLMPILAPVSLINLTTTAFNHIAFYDLISQTFIQIKASGGANAYHQIDINGLKANTAENGNAYGLVLLQLLSGFSSSNFHIGSYTKNTSLDYSGYIVGNLYNANIREDAAQLGYSSFSSTATFDAGTRANRGLRIASFDSSVKGLGCSLPLAGTTFSASNNADFTTTALNALSFNGTTALININTTIALISVGQAMSQTEIVDYDLLISTLMDALWTV